MLKLIKEFIRSIFISKKYKRVTLSAKERKDICDATFEDIKDLGDL
jgi:hypothetical protein